MRPTGTLMALCGTALLLACAETTAPEFTGNQQAAKPIGNNGEGFGNHEPIHVVPGAPPLERTMAQVWAVQGRQRKLSIRYQPAPGETEGKLYLEFAVSPRTQLVAPDGRVLARGDSVLITVRVSSTQLEAEFGPEGLTFSGTPADLMISTFYGETRGRPTQDLKVWYLPEVGAAVPQASRADPRAHSVSAGIWHFSNYAVAY